MLSEIKLLSLRSLVISPIERSEVYPVPTSLSELLPMPLVGEACPLDDRP
jgi:hypothetical protein